MSLVQTGANPEHLAAEFWIACMEAQVWEMKEQAKKGDYRHFFKEVADCIGVGFDCLRFMGAGDSIHVFLSRFAENLPKFENPVFAKVPRDTAYYLAKIEKIKKELGVAK